MINMDLTKTTAGAEVKFGLSCVNVSQLIQLMPV